MSSAVVASAQNDALLDSRVDDDHHKLGGWEVVKNIDEYIIELGRFAFMENKEKVRDLEFAGVEKAEFQVVAGKKYRLLVMASPTDNKIKRLLPYEAIVLDIPWEGTWKALSFIPLNQN